MSVRIRMVAAAIAIATPACVFAASPPGAASCLGCHAAAGADNPVVSLSSLTAEQIEAAMQAFRSGTRASTVMDRIAKGFSDEEIRAIAQWYARAKAK
jgi:cytochrome subunit of sulfide dehydrogenase